MMRYFNLLALLVAAGLNFRVAYKAQQRGEVRRMATYFFLSGFLASVLLFNLFLAITNLIELYSTEPDEPAQEEVDSRLVLLFFNTLNQLSR